MKYRFKSVLGAILAGACLAVALGSLWGVSDRNPYARSSLAFAAEAPASLAKARIVRRDEITGLVVTVEEVHFEQLTDSGTVAISVLAEPVDLDLREAHIHPQIVEGAHPPEGVYSGVRLLLSNPRLSLATSDAVVENVHFLDEGLLAIPGELVVEPGREASLVFQVPGVTLAELDDGSYLLIPDMKIALFTAGERAQAVGELVDINVEARTFVLAGFRADRLIRFADAEIFLPGDFDEGSGTVEDLALAATVFVFGTLNFDESITAEAVVILEYRHDCEVRCEIRAREFLAGCTTDDGQRCEEEADRIRAECAEGCHPDYPDPPCEFDCVAFAKQAHEVCISENGEFCDEEYGQTVEHCMADCPPFPDPSECEECLFLAEVLLTDCLSADGTIDCEPETFQILEECFLRCPDGVPHHDDTHNGHDYQDDYEGEHRYAPEGEPGYDGGHDAGDVPHPHGVPEGEGNQGHEDDPSGVPGSDGGGDSTQPHGGTDSGISGTAQELLDNLDQADADGDSLLSLTEAQTVNEGFTEEDFLIIDTNRDGMVSVSELNAQLNTGEGSGDTEGNGEGSGDTEGDNTNPSIDFSCAAKASTVRLPLESIAGDLALLAIATTVLSRRRRKPVR